MLIFKYLHRRFFGYFISITLLLAFLFNFIEFFEKLMRVKHASVLTILRFLGLRFLPSFFEMMPIGMWLATCLLLKELASRHELELMQLVTFSKKRFFSFFIIVGLIFTGTIIIINEKLIVPLSFHSEQFKQEHLKQGVGRKLVGKWFQLDQATFCYSDLVDMDAQKVSGLLMFHMSPDFTLEKIISSESAVLDDKRHEVTIIDGNRYTVLHSDLERMHAGTISLPSFFSQLAMHFKAPTLSSLLRKIFLLYGSLPAGVYADMVYDCLARVAFYLQLFLYPLVTFVLFCIVPNHRVRWGMMLLAYPLFTLLEVIGSGFFSQGFTPVVALLPGLIVSLFVFIGRLLFCG